MKCVFPLAALSLCLVGCGGSSSKNTTIPEQPTSALLQQLEADRVANNAGAISLAIYHKGDVVYTGAVGKPQVGKALPINDETLFQIGSTTKVLTSIAALQLIQNQTVNFDDTLTNSLANINYPNDKSAFWQSIQLDWLMTHQGGFEDSYAGIQNDSSLIAYMTDEFTTNNELMNKPGQFFNYSNPNYSYLGAVISSQSDMEYATYVEQEVLQKLGMTRSTFSNAQVKADGNYALSIMDNGFKVTDINQLEDPEVVLPAGGNTWSTPTEMLKLAAFILKGDEAVLNANLHKKITQKHAKIPGPIEAHYGYGMMILDGIAHNNQWYPIRHYQHGGNANAFTSMFYVFPEQDLAISILSSGEGDDLSDSLIAALEHVDLLPTPKPLELPSANTQFYDKFAGQYIADGVSFYITHAEQKLMLNIPALDNANIAYSDVIEPIAANTFVITIDDEQMAFTFVSTDDNHSFDYLVNRQLVATRLLTEAQNQSPALTDWLEKLKVNKINL